MSFALSLLLCSAVFSLTNGFRHTMHEKSYLSMTAVNRNENFAKLQAGYLFPEIARRRNAYLASNPSAKLISLGIGMW